MFQNQCYGASGFSRREFRNREAGQRRKHGHDLAAASVGANSGIVRRLDRAPDRALDRDASVGANSGIVRRIILPDV